ncbi:AhpC/TSA family protein [Persephonella hydrogeniphila]|uniref:AhpC/TSA family protein n=1 Tax=Persephonella hydrogeniphila TaxID=198703 RepID=A0A285NA70_9AQUI|nr:redoxin domain-containing protein [Persephonella hydrogeniphila]SNZ06372.1 AhpC/TSA family protein [Persephonella hydrogeniphila]
MRALIGVFMLIFSFSFGFDTFIVGKEFKDFTSIDEKGNEVKASQIVDHKPAVIIFFAIGDQPGTFKFLPNMNKLYEKYKDKVVFMAVLLSRSNPEEVKKLKKMLPLKIPVYLGYRDAIINYGIRKVDVPLILFVDRNGLITNVIARPESTAEEIYPPEKNLQKKESIEGRISQSIKIIDRYIKEIIKE